MAQSRPLATSPPPLSPRTHSEKKHHSRRKSGKDYVVSEKKSTRPAVSRRTTPQHITKVAPIWNGRSSHRDRDDDAYGGRDSGESFPQFCMTCEKQFLPANNTFLYCSEACRVHDQAPSQPIRSNSYSSSPPLTPYTRQFSSYPSTTTYEDGPDIIPRFSPTQSRPRSYFNSDPYPQIQSTYQAPSTEYSTSAQQTQYTPSSSSTALASLRELATALPKTSSRSSRNRDPESPPKSTASSITRTGSGVWDYIPFTSGSKTATPTPNATPGNSYTNTNGGGYAVSQSYGGAGRSKEDLYAYGNGAGYGYGKSHGTGGYGNTGGMGMDRPLPPRTAGHRPKSVDLVTPFSTGH